MNQAACHSMNRPTPPGDDVPTDSPEWHAWVKADNEWEEWKKVNGGIVYAFGRYRQFKFTWEDKSHVRPDGKKGFLCRWCLKPVEGRRRFYCSKECDALWVGRHIIPNGWGHWRDLAIARDGSKCVLCQEGPGSPGALRDEEDYARLDKERWAAYQLANHDLKVYQAYNERMHAIQERRKNRALEVDHIKPVAHYPLLEFTLENLRTLCHDCHRIHGARPKVKRIRDEGQETL